MEAVQHLVAERPAILFILRIYAREVEQPYRYSNDSMIVLFQGTYSALVLIELVYLAPTLLVFYSFTESETVSVSVTVG